MTHPICWWIRVALPADCAQNPTTFQDHRPGPRRQHLLTTAPASPAALASGRAASAHSQACFPARYSRASTSNGYSRASTSNGSCIIRTCSPSAVTSPASFPPSPPPARPHQPRWPPGRSHPAGSGLRSPLPQAPGLPPSPHVCANAASRQASPDPLFLSFPVVVLSPATYFT